MSNLKKAKPTATESAPTPDEGEAASPTRPEQFEIPGTGRASIKEIDSASEQYVNIRDRRMHLTEKEVAAKRVLSDLMRVHAESIGRGDDGGLAYRYDDMLVTLKPKDAVLRVKHVADDSDVTAVTVPNDDSEGSE